jgi:lysyl-tRNA synthetase class 2
MNLQSGQQIYLSMSDTQNFAETVTEIRRGDIVRLVRYEGFTTKTGEYTLRVFEIEVLVRCTQDIPLIVSDEDRTYNLLGSDLQRSNRVLNWISNPTSLNLVRERSRIISSIRRVLENDGAMEMETPILHPQYGGAAANPFITRHNSMDMDCYLRISPELYLKRLIIGGLDYIYEISRCFRNEGIDRSHNPEFTLLEFYRIDRDWIWGMEFTENMIRGILNIEENFDRIDYLESIRNLGHDIENLSANELDEIFSTHIEPTLIRPTFVCRHPVNISPLAYSTDGIVADRFELYINGMEIANGYTEQNDAVVQRLRMEEMGNVDEDYLNALSYGMPQTCGVGIGLDRLIMLATNNVNIRDVISFPL